MGVCADMLESVLAPMHTGTKSGSVAGQDTISEESSGEFGGSFEVEACRGNLPTLLSLLRLTKIRLLEALQSYNKSGTSDNKKLPFHPGRTNHNMYNSP